MAELSIHSFACYQYQNILYQLQTLTFMHQFVTGKLPKILDSFFFLVKTSSKRTVNPRFLTRSAFYLPKFEQTMLNLIFDIMDLSYGIKLMSDLRF